MSLTLTSRRILNHWTTREILFFLFKTAGKVRVSLVAQQVICLQCGRPGFDPWVGKIPRRRGRLPTPVFWPGEFHGL